MRQGQLLATGLIYTRQKYIVFIDETQKFTKTDSQLPIDPDPGASLTALLISTHFKQCNNNVLLFTSDHICKQTLSFQAIHFNAE